MKYLIDTHILIWHYGRNERLAPHLRSLLESEDNQIFVSAISLWEIAIKMSLGKLNIHTSFTEFLADILDKDFEILPLEIEHIIRSSLLPFHHRDPFDRMLVAQSLASKLPFVSQDAILAPYFAGTGIERIC